MSVNINLVTLHCKFNDKLKFFIFTRSFSGVILSKLPKLAALLHTRVLIIGTIFGIFLRHLNNGASRACGAACLILTHIDRIPIDCDQKLATFAVIANPMLDKPHFCPCTQAGRDCAAKAKMALQLRGARGTGRVLDLEGAGGRPPRTPLPGAHPPRA